MVATRVIKANPSRPEKKQLEEAARILRRGGLVAFPTETVYGLGANALDEEAVKKIFAAKGRPPDNPLILHIAEEAWLERIAAEVPPLARTLTARFWPGPLTLILKKRRIVPLATTGGRETVAVRMPANAIALLLILRAGNPIAAPSANLAGRPSPTRASHVLHDLNGIVDVIIDGGPTRIGVESTILDLTSGEPVLLRPGGVTREELEGVVGSVRLWSGGGEAFAPGMKYAHYAPRAPLTLIEAGEKGVRAALEVVVRRARLAGKRPGILLLSKTAPSEAHREALVIRLGPGKNVVARRLFSALRELDDHGVDLIIAVGIDEEGLGLAIMNRLRKAATTIIRPRKW